jgi:hypothetical protein
MIAGGLLLVIFVGSFSGVWLAFLGWFLLAASEAELDAAETGVALGGLTATDAMIRGVGPCPPGVHESVRAQAATAASNASRSFVSARSSIWQHGQIAGETSVAGGDQDVSLSNASRC